MFRDLILLLIFSSNLASGQKPITEKIIVERLNGAKTIEDIDSIVDSLGEESICYTGLFLKIPNINPLNPKNIKRISSSFGKRFHPIDKRFKVHNGIDIAGNIGTTVHSAADGIVEKIIYSKTGYGKSVTVRHSFGFETRYAHMAIITVLRKGQKVRRGEIIGMVGSTGKSTGNHLHFEVNKDGLYLDPIDFVKPNPLISSILSYIN